MTKSFRQLIGAQPSIYSAKDSVLVIIDAQNEYADGHLKTVNVAASRKAIADQLERYRSASAPVIHIVHDTPSGAPVFTPDTPLAAEFDELKPRDGEVIIHKQHPGSFTGTNLADTLEQTGRKKLVLVGYMAHICVSTTARQAAERGFELVFPREAIGDRDIPGVKAQDLVNTVLAELDDGFGTVVSVDDFEA